MKTFFEEKMGCTAEEFRELLRQKNELFKTDRKEYYRQFQIQLHELNMEEIMKEQYRLVKDVEGNDLVLFYNGPFSQWHPSVFYYDDIRFENAEMFMMWAKNKVFDGGLEEQILAAKHPNECKKLGRMIKNFNKDIWDRVAKDYVTLGNYLKFSQCSYLCEHLTDFTRGSFVECSPVDTIWGIGLDIDDPRCLDRSQWLGTNWLGECLDEAKMMCKNLYFGGGY